MKARYALLVPALSLLGCQAGTTPDPSANEEAASQDQSRIVGGQATSALPAVGALTRFGGTHCTGTLVEKRKVVTAAHCLEGVSASSLSFVIGPNVQSPEAVIGVASVVAHPGYNSQSLSNDIGYITLTADAPVEPMRIVTSMDSSWVGRSLIFVGYGVSNGFSQTGSGLKRFVEMDIAQVGATQFSYVDSTKNTCNGDSGGPAFYHDGQEFLIAGVTSYGDANCVQYGVDTRVDAYQDFLNIQNQSTPPVTPSDPCNGETFEGRCDGNTVVWCENDQVHTSSCSSQGKTCGFSEANQYYACIDDPCQGETFEGRCDGNTVIWCENEEVKSLNCPNACGFDTGAGYFNCL